MNFEYATKFNVGDGMGFSFWKTKHTPSTSQEGNELAAQTGTAGSGKKCTLKTYYLGATCALLKNFGNSIPVKKSFPLRRPTDSAALRRGGTDQ